MKFRSGSKRKHKRGFKGKSKIHCRKTRCQKRRQTRKYRKTGGNIESTTREKNSEGQTHIIKLWATWCGHCQTLNEIWPDVISEFKDKKIVFHDIESADMETKLIEKNAELNTDQIKVMTGYPTLLKLKNNVVSNYEGARDKDSLIMWIKQD
jgi:thiol-disulfide isomerase/thioredoxin